MRPSIDSVLGFLVAAAVIGLVACGDDEAPPSGQIDSGVTVIGFPGPDVYFTCHGSTGVYMAVDGRNGQSSPFAIADHPECQGDQTP